jgi:hypothetical protein
VKVYTLRRSQTVERSLGEVFAFFAEPENLERLTPSHLGFTILTPGPLVMREGALIDYSLRIMGISTFWTTMIETYEPPHRFVDVQLKGPYKFWHHTHRFKETEQGTVIEDIVNYVLPLGPLGRLARAFLVRHQLEKIFDYRADVIAELFAGGD